VSFPKRLSVVAIAAAVLVSAPAVAFAERENGGGGGGGEREGGRGVPGPVEGTGLPFIMAGGAVALAVALRRRRGT
jgi:hypothetical protein